MRLPNRRRLALLFRISSLLIVSSVVDFVCAQTVVLSVTPARNEVVAGTPEQIWLNALNPSLEAATWIIPRRLEVQIICQSTTLTNTFLLQSNAAAEMITIAPGTFARLEYQMILPATAVGKVIIEFPALNIGAIVLDVETPLVASTARTKKSSKFSRLLKEAEPLEDGKPFDPGRFFSQQISPHEPMYFIAGDESPNAKFQISFKYQLLSEAGWLAKHAPALKGFNVAYTQTSLWDLSAPSAPFFDTSYKPAFIYSWDRLVGREDVDWFRLDLQGGAQHESNGKGGIDSRSQNFLFFRPTFVFGRDDRFQLTLQPRVWGYVGDLSDNPDLDEYRGYFDLRAVIGWRRGLQLSALGRMGHEGNHHSAQFDLTYPMMKIVGSFSVYLQAQYFTGYGESLLRYNQRTDSFRVGFALYR